LGLLLIDILQSKGGGSLEGQSGPSLLGKTTVFHPVSSGIPGKKIAPF
jgi:hypothetical protein